MGNLNNIRGRSKKRNTESLKLNNSPINEIPPIYHDIKLERK